MNEELQIHAMQPSTDTRVDTLVLNIDLHRNVHTFTELRRFRSTIIAIVLRASPRALEVRFNCFTKDTIKVIMSVIASAFMTAQHGNGQGARKSKIETLTLDLRRYQTMFSLDDVKGLVGTIAQFMVDTKPGPNLRIKFYLTDDAARSTWAAAVDTVALTGITENEKQRMRALFPVLEPVPSDLLLVHSAPSTHPGYRVNAALAQGVSTYIRSMLTFGNPTEAVTTVKLPDDDEYNSTFRTTQTGVRTVPVLFPKHLIEWMTTVYRDDDPDNYHPHFFRAPGALDHKKERIAQAALLGMDRYLIELGRYLADALDQISIQCESVL